MDHLQDVTDKLRVLRNATGDLFFVLEGRVLYGLKASGNAMFPRDIIAMAEKSITNKISAKN